MNATTEPQPATEHPPEILIDRRGTVGIVTLNRPERLNAVQPAMGDTIRNVLLALEQDPEIRSIVLTGAGRAFCAGADISGVTGDAEAVLRDIWNPLVTTMLGLDLPIIAAVNGVAAGAGASLAFACDLRVASTSARFQLSFVKIGLIPDAGATWLLPRLVGVGRANELALLGGDLSAERAERWGLVNEVVGDGEVLEAATTLAERFGEVSASAARIKRLHLAGLDSPVDKHLAREAVEQGEAQREPDFAEATRAFRERRPARFAPRVPPQR